MTNGDVIRSMTNEHLAEFMAGERLSILQSFIGKFNVGKEQRMSLALDTYSIIYEWLKKETEK